MTQILNPSSAPAEAIQPTSTANELPKVIVSARQLRDLTEEALKALEAANTPPELFVRSGRIHRVQVDEKKRPFITAVTEAMLRGRLARSANFGRETNHAVIHALPPMYVVRDILGLGSWPFPPIEAIVETPVLRPDGTVLDSKGHDSATGLYYWPSGELELSHIPERPTEGEVAKAMQLLQETIGDFPYDSEASRANALALLLTPIVRPAIQGTVPLALLDAPQQGTGKSLLANVIALIATGRHAAMMAAPNSDEEWRKRITSTLAKGATVITIDNIEGRFASPSLANALTANIWQDRLLGFSETVELAQRATWMATGNNIRLGGDMQRRCYWIRLDAKSATPWLERTFKHPRLLDWVAENRQELIAALLTIARAWFAAGKASGDTTRLGGFEEWCDLLGGILAHAGVTGFLGNLTSLYSVADEESEEWECFLAAIQNTKHLGGSFTTSDLVAALEADPALQQALPSDLSADWVNRDQGAVDFNKRLGKAISSRNDRRYGDLAYHLSAAGVRQHAKLWRVVCDIDKLTEPLYRAA